MYSSDDSDEDHFNYLTFLDNLSWKRSDVTQNNTQRNQHELNNGLKAITKTSFKSAAKPIDKTASKPAVAIKSRFNRNDSLLKDMIASEKDKNKDEKTETVRDRKRDLEMIEPIIDEDLDDIVASAFNEPIVSNNNNNDNKNSGSLNQKNKRQRVDDSEYSVTEILNKKKANHEKIVANNINNNKKIDLNRVKGDRQFGKAFSPTVYSPEVPVMRGPVAKPSTLTNTSVIQKALTFNDESQCSSTYKPNRILSIILDWNTKWLTECNSSEVPNTLTPFGEGTGLKTCYESLEEYQAAYIPLILYETWAQAFQDYDKSEKEPFMAARSPDITSDEHFITLHLQIAVPKCKVKSYPSDGYLCLIELFIDHGVNNEKKKLVLFGYIMDMYTDKMTPTTPVLPDVNVPPMHSNPQLIKYWIVIAKKPIRVSHQELVRVMPFHYLRPTIRQFELIASLNSSPLFKDILRPRSFTCQVVVPTNISLSNLNFNESQNRAILGSSEALSRPYAVPKILFIQGPPGTGKTHTLIGIIKHIYRNWEAEDRLPRILICAPSNGAVDEIARRLYMERNSVLNKHKNEKHHRGLRLVRIGKESQMHPDVRKISFDSLIKDNSDNELKRWNSEKNKKATELEKKIQKLDQEVANYRAVGRKSDMERCHQEMQHWMMELQKLNSEPRNIEKDHKTRLRTDIMCHADIVLSTLNSSHQQPIEKLYRIHGPSTFDCVIVDEASQCSEPELLMPLAYKMTKMILIGDPMQLPATVISKKASNLQFGRSLFERFYHYFRQCEQSDPEQTSPILMLTEQYRMHPQICSFPSSQFYDGKLVSSPKVVKSRDFKLKPYILFDVTDTSENRSNPTNKYNELEANFVVRLVTLIDEILTPSKSSESNPHRIYSIGVITPYNGQKNHLLNKIEKKTFKNTTVEINTVDGFQGQEKDVIILSAVRAFDNQNNSNRYQTIGFLDSVQRLNVALTRAKYSMILCISARSLEKDKNWKSLIDDAGKRVNCRFKLPSTVKHDALKHMLIKPETINLTD